MPPKSTYPDATWLDDQYNNYPPSFGPSARPRRRDERQIFTVYEDPDCHDDDETAAATDPGLENPNAQSITNAETIPGPQANMEHPVNNNVPETPSTFAATSFGQMMLASRRRLVASAPETFGRDNNNADEHGVPPSPSPALGGALPKITSAGGRYPPEEEPPRSISPRMNVGERLVRAPFYGFVSDDTSDHESFDATFPPPLIGEEAGFGLTPNRKKMTAEFPLPQTPASRMPPPQTPASRMRPSQSPASRLLRPSGSTPALIVRSTGTHDDGIDGTPVARRLFHDPSTTLDSTPMPNVNAWEPQLVRQPVPHTPLRPSRLRSVSFTLARNEDTEMASPIVTTPECQSDVTHVTTSESQTGETESFVTMPEFQTEVTRVTTPERKTGVATPEFQTGGTPPTPRTPRTPRTWISLSQLTPELEVRTIAPPVYRNRDEFPMEITPSPPGSPPSLNDKDMADAFWTPNKPRPSSTTAGVEEKDAAAQKPTQMKDAAPVQNKAHIANSAPFGDAVAQDFPPIQNAAQIENPVPSLDAVSPGTTTVRTVISTEITTTIMKTPSPQQSPIPARRVTANLRPSAATPRRASRAPRRQAASTPQRKGKDGAEQKTNRRRTADQIVPGGINRRQELRTSPRYSLRDSTRGIMPGTYSITPVRNKTFGVKGTPEKK